MFKRTHYIAAGIVVLVTLLVLNLPGRTATRLKLTISSLYVSLFGLAGGAQQIASKAGDAALPRSELIRQNEALRRENQELKVRQLQAEELARENDRLRQLVQWRKQTRWNLKLAHVVLRDPANWWKSVQIDLGSRDGVRENFAVLTPEGLVGRVAEVGLTRSRVILVGDPNCKVAAVVENEARDKGIIGVSGPFDGSLVEMTYLSRNANLKPGQKVSSSGLGGLFASGIPIGWIADVRPVESGLSVEARVKLAVDLGGLDEVWVMFP